MRDIALRNGTLDRNAGRDSERVVRTFLETHAISAMASSTTEGCEGERSGLNHWRQITQRTACSRADICRSGRQSCEPELNYRMRDIAPRNGTLDRNAGRDSERVVRTFRETHAISAMASSTTGCEKKRSANIRSANVRWRFATLNRLAMRVGFFIRKSNKFFPLKWKIYFAVRNGLWYIISII